MNKEINPKIIGGFVLGAVILVVVIFLVFGSGRFFKDTFNYVIYFRGSVNGLKIGSPVKIRGVEFGSVKKITPLSDKEGNFHVEVIIETDSDVVIPIGGQAIYENSKEELEFLISRGLRAQLNVQSIVLGLLYVKIDYFPDTEIVLGGFNPEFLEVPSIPTPGENLSEDIERTAEKIRELPLEEISQSLITTLENIDVLAKNVRTDEAMESLTLTLDELRDVLNNLNKKIDPISEGLVGATQEARESFDKSEELLSNMNKIAVENRYALQLALKDISAASRAIRNLADYLERNPNSILRGKK